MKSSYTFSVNSPPPQKSSDRIFFCQSFMLFLTVNTIASAMNHIDDTDETFGYWEPTHYLVFGSGMQTWEYSPEYALRSYAFIAPLLLLSNALCMLGVRKEHQFYVIRACIGAFTAYCEASLVSSVVDGRNRLRAYMLQMLISFSPGIFYFSTSFLPSAVGSSLLMLSISSWLTDSFISSIFYGCVAVVCTGWPFIGVVFGPMGAHMLFCTYSNSSLGGLKGVAALILSGILSLAITVIYTLAVDINLYGNW